MEAFELLIIENPTEEEAALGAKPAILVGPITFLDDDLVSAAISARRAVPAAKKPIIDQIEIVVRPFGGVSTKTDAAVAEG